MWRGRGYSDLAEVHSEMKCLEYPLPSFINLCVHSPDEYMHQNALTSVVYVQQRSSTTAPSHGILEYTQVRCERDSNIFVFSLVIFKYLLSLTSLLSGKSKIKTFGRWS